MHLDPKHLVQLHTIVELGSFALAAEYLSLTQPALSRNIRLLEERVGARLLHRGRHGATPTELGRLLSAKGRVLRELLDEAGKTASAIRAGELGQLRLGLSFGVASEFLAEPIGTFLQKVPKASVQTTVGPTPLLLDRLGEGELDLVVGGVQLVPESAGIEFKPLIANRLAVVARAKHPFASRGRGSLDALRAARWIVRPKTDPLQVDIASAMTSIGLTYENVALETPTEALALAILARTDLLMLVPYATAQSFLSTGNFVEIAVPIDIPLRPLGVAQHADRTSGPTVRAFLEILWAWAQLKSG